MQTTATYRFDRLLVHVFPDRPAMGEAAAVHVASALRAYLREEEQVRMVFAAAPSQDDFFAALVQEDLDWARVVAFQMDEYLGLPPAHPQRFSAYLQRHLYDHVPVGTVHTMQTWKDDIRAEIERYTARIAEAPLDIICMGIGENGHLAFNDPPVADFQDPELLKVVTLEAACRQQQVNDGCFATLTDVPEQAITLTIPALMSGQTLSIVVPGYQKAKAVQAALEGGVEPACPASILRIHPQATLFVDQQAYLQMGSTTEVL